MTPLKKPIVFTANTLLDGEAVWMDANGKWLTRVDHALVVRTAEEKEAAEKLAFEADTDNRVVEPYEIDVLIDAGVAVPTKFREQIRANGPTIRLDLGKQAEGLATAA